MIPAGVTYRLNDAVLCQVATKRICADYSLRKVRECRENVIPA